jgi:cell filamentation protein
MANDGKYAVTGSEGEWQPGSNDQVLKNALGIIDPEEMAEVETGLLLKLYEHIFERDFPTRLTPNIIQAWHSWWLGNLYPWAGKLRSVNMSKADIDFAAAKYVSPLLSNFSSKYLEQYNNLPSYDEEK